MGLEHDPTPETSEICDCGKPARWHKGSRFRFNREYHRGYERENPKPPARSRIIGIDGEGQGRGPHVYNYVAAADENGQTWEVGSDPNRQVSTPEFLDFILDLPLRSLIFAFAFLYDLTKGLQGLPDESLYLLFHEKERRRIVDRGLKTERMVYSPVKWGEYSLNYMNRKFTVKRGGRSATVWDVFAFFQSKFTKACIDWQIGEKTEVEEMERMKERRSTFDAQSFWEIKQYCQTECKNLALLGRQLLDAHEINGWKLVDFYGAGSTAKALMNKYDVRSYIDNDVPDEMHEGIACAFFGGRFENSIIGAINRPVWNADINSAYPYAATGLPCLIHGRWRKCRPSEKGFERSLGNARLALISWHLPKPSHISSEDPSRSWGPLPVRKADGTIAFPLGAFLGWTWKEEFLAARKLRPDVRASVAWVYDSDCKCRPFSFLAEVYLERLRIGKDSRGIVLKLGPNSVYGKLVQSLGWKPPFQCWIWGGNITSTCRAQLLEGMALAPSLSNVLMLATDGLWSDCEIRLPAPRDTGTSHAAKPLGGWDVKKYEKGVFAARPGIYFPMDPTEDELSKVRARGLGRRVLYEQWRLVRDAYERGQDSVLLGARCCDVASRQERGSQRFIGAKTGMKWTPKGGVRREKGYGEWLDWPTEVSFDPAPKREAVLEDGRLKCWDYFEAPSLPYDPAIKTEEDDLLELAMDIAEEQPNAEWVDE